VAVDTERPASPRTATGPASLAGWLGTVRGHLTPELIGDQALDRIEGLTRRLPPEALGALEIRLHGRAGVDLSVRLLSPESCHQAASRLRRPVLHDLATTWESDPRWAQTVSALWLEIDLPLDPADDPAERAPIVCARVERFPDMVDLAWITEQLLPTLGGRRLTSHQKESALRILRGLPPTAWLLYAFDLSPRGNREIRLELFGPARNDLVPFVHDVTGGTGTRQAEQALELLGDLDRLHLSVDIDPTGGISPRIGIDGSYRKAPSREPRWRMLFERLVAAGLCAPKTKDAVLDWPGYDSFWTAPEGWPLPGGGIGGFCVRALSHIKLVTRPDTGPEAKAYLLFGHVGRTIETDESARGVLVR